MRLFVLGSAAVLMAVAVGCTNVAVFEYAQSSGNMVQVDPLPAPTATVAVMPFIDARPFESSGSLALGLIPLFPGGRLNYSQPDNGDNFVSLGRYDFDPANDLARAAYMSLRKSNLFADVKLANRRDQIGDADYVWQGTVTNTAYHGTMLTYCITYFASPVLWLVGCPSGVSTNELGVKFELLERKSGRAVWSYEFNDSDYLTHWIYARIGDDTKMYPELMKKAMNQAIVNLNGQLPR